MGVIVDTVTISDCGRVLEEIDRELAKLAQEAREIIRKQDALRTQGLIIHELLRRIA